jgi:hypothetical protein
LSPLTLWHTGSTGEGTILASNAKALVLNSVNCTTCRAARQLQQHDGILHHEIHLDAISILFDRNESYRFWQDFPLDRHILNRTFPKKLHQKLNLEIVAEG